MNGKPRCCAENILTGKSCNRLAILLSGQRRHVPRQGKRKIYLLSYFYIFKGDVNQYTALTVA
jgi:sulfate adenylyltransferase subunit 1 (EFTu-like GTPase family)